ncbi:hypothetical protein ACN28I_16830 [Archangium gephyra]|uniref:hypothetical protein n=1 Tax=Archangium gephyra TaxID=48 RepID=UPI003B788F20
MLSTPLLVTWLALAAPPAAPSPALQASEATSSASDATSVYSLGDGAFVDQALRDLEAVERYAQGLRALQEQISKTRGLYHRKQDIPYTPDEKRTLLTTWAAFSDYFASLELIRQRYWDFIKVPALTQQTKHAWGFLLTHGALTTELAHGLTYAEAHQRPQAARGAPGRARRGVRPARAHLRPLQGEGHPRLHQHPAHDGRHLRRAAPAPLQEDGHPQRAPRRVAPPGDAAQLQGGPEQAARARLHPLRQGRRGRPQGLHRPGRLPRAALGGRVDG